MIIPGSWIFALAVQIPRFVNTELKKERDQHFCFLAWPVPRTWLFFVVFVFASSLMAGLYSRVVYTLWFKYNDDNELTCQQKV